MYLLKWLLKLELLVLLKTKKGGRTLFFHCLKGRITVTILMVKWRKLMIKCMMMLLGKFKWRFLKHVIDFSLFILMMQCCSIQQNPACYIEQYLCSVLQSILIITYETSDLSFGEKGAVPSGRLCDNMHGYSQG